MRGRRLITLSRAARLLPSALSFGIVTAAALGLLMDWRHPGPTDLPAPAAAAPELPPAPAVPEGPEKLELGLALSVEGLDASGKVVAGPDVRSARMLSLYVPQGVAPSSFVPAGRFRATWDGNLNLKLREKFALLAEGRGKLTVSVNDKEVFRAEGEEFAKTTGEEFRMKKGANRVVVVYESPEKGDAAVRIFWTQKGLPPEPIAPTNFTHNVSAKPTRLGNLAREGRFLLADLRCVKCHSVADVVDPQAKDAMPELAMDSPSLKDVGARLNQDWMASWINNPRAARPDAHMPRLFHDGGDDPSRLDPRAADVAAYLATLGAPATAANGQPPAAAAAAPPQAQIDQGGQLFAALTCLACHTAPDAQQPASPQDGRVPLGHVRSKYKPGALEAYLLQPHAHYAWNPMPDFKLSKDEAAALAAYLTALGTPPAQPPAGAPAGDPARGGQLVLTAGCMNCHELEGTNAHKASNLSAIGAAGWTRGCMAPDAAGRKQAADYGLTDGQRTALLTFASNDRTSLKREAPPEFSARQVAAMRCAACHARDGQESLISSVFAAEQAALTDKYPPPGGVPHGAAAAAGRAHGDHPIIAPDQRAPLLTWAGEKLRPDWATRFIAGEVPYKPRYYLYARMPAFTVRAGLLAHGLAAEHGCPPAVEPYTEPDATMVPVGQKLVGVAGGFSCVTCHPLGKSPPTAPFEAPAINFAYVTDRLRKDFYHRWMRGPMRLDPATKMPQFSDADLQTALRDVYDGDATKQFEALWQFFLAKRDQQGQ